MITRTMFCFETGELMITRRMFCFETGKFMITRRMFWFETVVIHVVTEFISSQEDGSPQSTLVK